MKKWLHQYKHAWVFLYGLIYMPWFLWLEQHVTEEYHVIHSALDDYIPFQEIFIIPYMLWFAYIAVTVGYFFFKDKAGFYRLVTFLFTGMTIFLIICTFFPNGQNLRPVTFARDNIFVDMVKMLYRTDTPTNVLPSIHVFNSIGAAIAIGHSETLSRNRLIRFSSVILSSLIILSTMFLKQHSVIDVVSAFLMASVMYSIVYVPHTRKESLFSRQIAS